MLWMLYEVQLVGIHYHDGHIGDMVEIIHVGTLYILQIIRTNFLLKVTATVGDVFQQMFDIVMQIEDDVGFGKVGGDDVVNFDIEVVLIALEVVFGENITFVDEIVGDDEVGEEVTFGEQGFELLVAVGEERHFEREGVMLWFFVEFGQERIVDKAFEHQLGVELS